ESYWLVPTGGADAGELGLGDSGHPLLGGELRLADGDSTVLTGRLSPSSWLADHAVGGTVVLPGTAFVDMALHAGALTGRNTLDELVIEAPLVLDEPVQVQVRVEGGSVTVHSGTDGAWTLHATGSLGSTPAAPQGRESAWPPPGEPLDPADLYNALGDRGLEYGPAFQGLTAAWRDGDTLYAEVRVPDHGFGIHPALLDAALHPSAATTEGLTLPFSWNGVELHATGATELWVRITPRGNGVALHATDPSGQPVVTIESLVTRPVSREQFASRTDGLYEVAWSPVTPEAPTPHTVLDVPRNGDLHEVTEQVLAALQEQLTEDGGQDAATTLVVRTRDAVHTATPDPAAAAVWGLVRSAQAENPGRIVLADTDSTEDNDNTDLAPFIADEPQIAIRDGKAYAPRLTRTGPAEPVTWTNDDTVLITGGTGTLGAHLARHLITEHGVGSVVLVGRRGVAPESLADLDAHITTVACDTSDREAVRELLSGLPDLTAVVHTAGVTDDALLTNLTPEQLHTVLRNKADAAWNLHELTLDRGLKAFVLYSSLAGTLGNAGQANYAAANAYLDALAHHRHAQGLPATSIAWGLWEDTSGTTGHLTEADRARIALTGLTPITAGHGAAMFDAAIGATAPAIVATPLNLTALNQAPTVHPLLSGLTRRTTGRGRAAVTAAGTPNGTDAASMDRAELRALVMEHVAATLGHGDAGAVDADTAFNDLGFDSLTAVELRNRIGKATGVRLPATLVFDHPTPAALAEALHGELSGQRASRRVAVRESADEPIAVVGMACRFPGGVATPEQLWQMLAAGADGITAFPADRGWDLEAVFDPDGARSGTTYSTAGGFLHDAGDFDPAFFGISPREATAMDPQQRLLLETAWETLESAGIDPTALRGSDTGVFAGAMYQDYRSRFTSAPKGNEDVVGAGNAGAVTSGRVSYVLGLEGPSMTVDTACSSSLVATHLAVQALRQGECSLSLAGGVTVMATPEAFIEFSRQGNLAPDGRCKAFGAEADGTGISEGVGLLLLERLSDAERNGHRVLATIRGSAVNQDGASNGLTAPNGPSQERVILQALANARLDPSEVDAVEAHGTGTTLGDPIEAQAVLATYGQDRPTDRPLRLGSLKSNIGHTQAAAGVGGIIKMIMAMRHGVLPKTLHADTPSPHVDWSAGAVELLTDTTAWPETGRPRRSAVSSFGISGTNAHIILEQPGAGQGSADDDGGDEGDGSAVSADANSAHTRAERDPAPGQAAGPVPSLVSAKTPEALKDQVPRLPAHPTRHPGLAPADVAHTLARRTPFGHRAALLGDLTLAEGEAGDGGLAFLFTGQGAQRAGMGAGLYESYPDFRRAFDSAIDALDAHLGAPSLRSVLFEEASLLDQTLYTQPALFALETALYRLFESWGVTPDRMAGHSIGELAAAHVSGILTLQDAARLVTARARLMNALPTGGTMAAVQAAEEEVAPFLTEAVGLAAVNGPTSLVVSGDDTAVEAVVARFADRKTRRLTVSHAFHSHRMDPMLDEFRSVARELTYSEPRIPIVSTVATDLPMTDPDYWVAQARATVRFHQAVTALAEDGTTTYIELGPDGVLTAQAQQSAEGTFAPALRRDRDEVPTVLTALGTAFVHGRTPRIPEGDLVDLPGYAFQRQRYWLVPTGDANAAELGLSEGTHPLLGGELRLAHGEGTVLTGRLSPSSWLADHAVGGTVVLPGTAFVDMALHAGTLTGRNTLEELVIEAPLVLTAPTQVQVAVTGDTVTVHSRTDGDWTLNAAGRLSDGAAEETASGMAWPPAADPVDVDEVYTVLGDRGLEYGPAFHGLTAAWRDGDTLYAEVRVPDHGFGIHPALLDAALHPSAATAEDLTLPFSWNGVTLHSTGATAIRVRLVPDGGSGLSLEAVDENGAPVLTVSSMTTRPVSRDRLASRTDGLYEIAWTPVTPEAPTPFTAVEVPRGGEVHEVTEGVLAALREKLASADTDASIAVVTRDAVHTATP
ncbi:type I polyketide synthase, partial [Nocardiopsis chromatogenes]|uniref:type I polyketide synthase n=1 Tax=Nocardiopsis chromatogenes TaxID=280239 RepID=UPI000370F7D6